MSALLSPATPYLRVDPARLRLNIRRTAELAAAAGVSLRPHVKTHKNPEFARLQLAAGAVGITVATIGEAETFARHGCDDVFVAYPLWPGLDAARRLQDLMAEATVAVGVDSVESAGHLGRHLGGTGMEVLVEVDSGQHRSGTLPGEAGAVAAAARRAGLVVRGVFTFPGHSYDPQATVSAAGDESRALHAAAASLRAAGIEPRVISGGSTPSLAHTDTDLLTELRPGVYVFGDAQQWELGTIRPEDIALVCRSTVVSHAGAGSRSTPGARPWARTGAPYATGFGRLCEYPDARIVSLSEHHAVADLGGTPLPPLGSQVDVVPNHVCNAVNLADWVYVDDPAGLRPSRVEARGQNS